MVEQAGQRLSIVVQHASAVAIASRAVLAVGVGGHARLSR
jgi:hypothetical protein